MPNYSNVPGQAGSLGHSAAFGGNGQPGSFDAQASQNEGDYSAIPGNPGIDYPIYSSIPETSFDCKQQQWPGYYADVEAQCQVFHICALNTTFNFLCPNGTVFSQEHLVCVWWNQFDCNTAPSLYGKNAYIYDYTKVGQPGTAGQGSPSDFIGGQASNIPGNSIQSPSTNFGTNQGSFGPSSSFDGAQGNYIRG